MDMVHLVLLAEWHFQEKKHIMIKRSHYEVAVAGK